MKKYEVPSISNLNEADVATPEPRGAVTVFVIAGVVWIVMLYINWGTKPPYSCCKGAYMYA